MRVELAGFYQRLGTMMIYVAEVEAMTMATRIAVLNAGIAHGEGTVTLVEYLGSEILVHVRLPSGKVR